MLDKILEGLDSVTFYNGLAEEVARWKDLDPNDYNSISADRGQYSKGYKDRDSEIVQCKDCRQKHIGGSVTHYYWCDLWDREVDGTDFCAWGERKEP